MVAVRGDRRRAARPRTRWLNDRYRVDEPVGGGTLFVVWRGYDAALRRSVAVKMAARRAAAERRLGRRLRAEARAAARLSHPNVARVYDYGESAASRTPFVVFEFVNGYDVQSRLSAAGPLPVTDAGQVCADVADALGAAHARGLVHRDIKPANVMLSPAGVKVVDFGIAADAGRPATRGTDGLVPGTRAYMAPEQEDGAPADPAADMYSFGLLLRECLTARRSRPDADPPALTEHRLGTWPWLPAGVPRPVERLVRACLSDAPGQRPSGAVAAAVLRGSAARGSD
jgi:serine/threonine-protein kinase